MEHTSEFNTKLEKACHKKEALFDESKMRYALRSMFAGAFLTMSTAAGAHAAQIIAGLNPALSRFTFAFIFTWGLVYVVFLNGELATSNMMFLTAGAYQKHIKWSKAIAILFYCTLFNLVGAMFIGALFANSSAFNGINANEFIAKVAELKLSRSNELILLEGILANVFVLYREILTRWKLNRCLELAKYYSSLVSIICWELDWWRNLNRVSLCILKPYKNFIC